MKILRNKEFNKLVEEIKFQESRANYHKQMYKLGVEIISIIIELSEQKIEITRQEMLKNVEEQWE